MRQHKFTRIAVTKIFAINRPPQPMCGCQLGYHNLFTLSILHTPTPFTAKLFLHTFEKYSKDKTISEATLSGHTIRTSLVGIYVGIETALNLFGSIKLQRRIL